MPQTQTSKLCTKCKTEKPTKAFSRRGGQGKWKDSLLSHCRECIKPTERKTKERYKKSNLEGKTIIPFAEQKCNKCKENKPIDCFYKNNSRKWGINTTCMPCERSKMLNFNATDKGRYGAHRRGARIRNLNFDISLEQYIQIAYKPCNYCGKFFRKNTNGIDRVDNNVGYVFENCVACCLVCNRMKNDLEKEEFFNHLLLILKHCGKL